VKQELSNDQIIIYTGPIDRFFNFSEGRLGWRTLDFDLHIYDQEDFQGCSVINYADINIPFTRVHEFKHLHPEREQGSKTAVM
jgi:UDP-galactopyranose mutase